MNESMICEEKSSLTKIIIESVASFILLPTIHSFNFICVYTWYDMHLGIQDSELRNHMLKSVWRPILRSRFDPIYTFFSWLVKTINHW